MGRLALATIARLVGAVREVGAVRSVRAVRNVGPVSSFSAVRKVGAVRTVCAVLIVGVMLTAVLVGACGGEDARYPASDEELVAFIAAHSRMLQDHRERCDALLGDFDSTWRSASREEVFPVLGVLSAVEGEIVWTLVTWERMPDPEADEVAELNGAFFDYLGLVLASSRLVSRSMGFSYRSTEEARVQAARDAATKLAEARAAEARLAALLRGVQADGGR